MIKTAAALHLFNVVWPIGRRTHRYEYRPVPRGRDVPAGGNAAPAAREAQDPPPGRALRPAPPAWRACRADMPRTHFLCLACGWAGAVVALLVAVLLIRLLG